jgi:hypothetical protein
VFESRQRYFLKRLYVRPSGGIGRRIGLKIRYPLWVCGFESRLGYSNWIGIMKLSDSAAGALATQLYRYYDIEADGIQNEISEVRQVEFKTFGFKVPVYRVFYEVESGITDVYVSMKIHANTIEDLYLVDHRWGLEEPSTSKAEQEAR